ncbi:hypothetical protein EMCRGX_G032269 [Ephydatia muelleri]
MGSVNSFLTAEDYRQIEEETGFQKDEVRRLYSRYAHLDKRSKGFLEQQDLMLIPELASNPLGTRIIEAFFTDDKDPTVMLDALNFRQFVSVIACFRRVENPSRQLIHKKLEFIFRVFDTDRDGWVSETDVRNILSAMFGLNIPESQLNAIVRRVMKADVDQDKRMSLDEFKQALGQVDLAEKISVNFLS